MQPSNETITQAIHFHAPTLPIITQAILMSMAHLFGLRTSLQGSKRFVVAARTDQTCFPEGNAEGKVGTHTRACEYVLQR